MDLFLDTSFIVPLIIETDTTKRARDFYSSFSGTWQPTPSGNH